MATISAQTVKELRDRTGVGMMDCKKALTATDGDMELAVEHLRKAGLAKAAKKAGRRAEEGSIVALIRGGSAALVEILCETDFVARNERFRNFANSVAERLLADETADGDVAEQVAAVEKVAVGELVGAIGENIQIRRALRWTTDGVLGSYLHMGGRIGVLVDVAETADAELAKNICMHIAAFSPRFVGPDDVPETVLAKEKEIAAAQVAGKPAQIIDKIVTGKINKWFKEACLTRQPWIRDDKTCLAKVAPEATVRRFLRWQVGEEL